MRSFVIFCSLILLASCCRFTQHVPFFGDNSVEKSSSKQSISHKQKHSHKHSKKSNNALLLKKSFPLPNQPVTPNEMEMPEEMKSEEKDAKEAGFFEEYFPHFHQAVHGKKDK